MKTVRLSLLIDLDGVLADFEKRRFDILTSRGLPAVPPAEIQDFYGVETYRARFGRGAVSAARAVTMEPGFFEGMDPIPGALEGAHRLLERGHDVRICSKPLAAHPNCTAEKLAWVRKHLGPWWYEHAIITSKKSEYVADALIDDRPDLYAHTIARNEPEPKWAHVLFAQPWNRTSTGHDHSMKDWNDFGWLEWLESWKRAVQ